MLSGAKNTQFGSLKYHLVNQMLLGHNNYPKNREDKVGLVRFWKGLAEGNKKNTAIQEAVAVLKARKDGSKTETKAGKTTSTVFSPTTGLTSTRISHRRNKASFKRNVNSVTI